MRGKSAATAATLLLLCAAVVAAQVVCPDQHSQCPENTTCCDNGKGGYGCCPYPQATCCSDKAHCCPSGYECDLQAMQCVKHAKTTHPRSMRMAQHESTAVATASSSKPVGDVTCPDQQSSCPDGTTCCELAQGGYGCCPYPQATCCSDKAHCCPNGYTCNVQAGQCVKQSSGARVAMRRAVAATPVAKPVGDVTCPDQQSSCPDGTTCCELAQGGYGCCPYPQATCCSDKAHCCPNGYTCNVQAGQCVKQSSGARVAMRRAVAAKPVGDVTCPDQQSSCPDGTTCCELAQGGYGCCPYPQATCCSDKAHCCPNGYTCNVQAGQCVKQSSGARVAMRRAVAATPVAKPVGDVTCPDQQSSCPDGTTCCELAQGGYGCCPYPQATCCSDKAHCCPNGYTCNVQAGQCVKQSSGARVAMRRAVAAKPVGDVTCPDQQSSCPDGTTCCELAQGGYGCCPYPQATCCSDKAHCCPNGYTCNVQAGQCVKQSSGARVAMRRAVAAKPVGDVTCPDQQSSCPDGTTCCELAQGGYGCCPYPQATCCSDKAHCCPNGYTCNVQAGQCVKQSSGARVAMRRAVAAKPVGDVTCPDQQSSCPDGTTCCELAQGGYGCCPYPQATCCSDKAHCCPNGYTCNVQAGQCVKQSSGARVAMRRAVAAKPVGDVTCPDQQSSCPDGTTCCELAQGGYGCCPYPQATCCSDKAHCCPNGYTCNVQAGQCVKQSSSGTSRVLRAHRM